MKDYLKCVIANKFTLAGYVSFGLAAVDAYFDLKLSNNLWFISGACFGLSHGGIHTLFAYKKIRETIENKEFDKSKVSDTIKNHYCDRAGLDIDFHPITYKMR